MTNPVDTDHETLQSFFYAELEGAQERTGASLPPEVGAYVVDLLARYARRTGAAGRKSQALALEYLSAKETQGSARARALRGVGDRALYISGVVPRSLARGAVRVDYVRSIGAAAYQEVADSGPLAVFRMLAELFATTSEVMADMVEPAHAETTDLIGLYERWRAHRDPRDAKRLLRAGVLLETTGVDDLQ